MAYTESNEKTEIKGIAFVAEPYEIEPSWNECVMYNGSQLTFPRSK